MKFDDASWHYDSTPKGSEEKRWDVAAAHIGIYLKWCLLKGWAGELHTEDETSAEAVEAVKTGTMTGTKFLIEQCDCKLTNEDLSDEGLAFTSYYYDDLYPHDAEPLIDGKMLSSPEEKYDFARLSAVIDKRYADWLSAGRPAKMAKKPWWKLW